MMKPAFQLGLLVVGLLGTACSGGERTPATAGSDAGANPNESITTPVDVENPDGGSNAACTQNVDIVFVMDVSTSMGAFLKKLAQEMEAVDTSLKTISPTASPYYGLTVFVDDARLLNNGAPFQNAASVKGEFEKWAAFTFGNQQVGGGGSNNTWPENSLDALYAATNFSWRPGSLRIVIHTTDDTFWDGPTSKDGVSIQHSYAETVKALQDKQIRVFSFASKKGGSSENDDVAPGWFVPYKGQDPIPKATFGEAYELDGVLKGQASLSSSIYGLVSETFCKPYSPIR